MALSCRNKVANLVRTEKAGEPVLLSATSMHNSAEPFSMMGKTFELPATNTKTNFEIGFWAFYQMIYIGLPLVILIISNAVLGIPWDEFKLKPDWTFLSLIFFAEALRDGLKHSEETSENWMRRETGIILSIAFIALTSCILFASIALDLKKICDAKGGLNKDALVVFQWVLLGGGVVFCFLQKFSLKKVEDSKKEKLLAFSPQ